MHTHLCHPSNLENRDAKQEMENRLVKAEGPNKNVAAFATYSGRKNGVPWGVMMTYIKSFMFCHAPTGM